MCVIYKPINKLFILINREFIPCSLSFEIYFIPMIYIRFGNFYITNSIPEYLQQKCLACLIIDVPLYVSQFNKQFSIIKCAICVILIKISGIILQLRDQSQVNLYRNNVSTINYGYNQLTIRSWIYKPTLNDHFNFKHTWNVIFEQSNQLYKYF